MAGSVSAKDTKPNILFIMADDLGWMDLAVQGNKLVETPHDSDADKPVGR